MNTPIYAFALGKTTVTHIHGCVVTTLYPTLPRFKSKMALVWDRSMHIHGDVTVCLQEMADKFARLSPPPPPRRTKLMKWTSNTS